MTAQPCPCGLSAPYSQCCGRYHAGLAAPSPEALMRSRYSAFALGLSAYLQATWHSSTRAAELDVSRPPQPKWINLKILHTALHDATHGTVHFIARYRAGGRAGRLEEISRFVCEEGRWYYIDGDIV